MHEIGLASEIHRLCRAHLEASGPARLERVWVAIGELSAVEPELLQFAWEAVTAGGPDAGAQLEIDWHAAKQVCEDCGEVAERVEGSWLRLCPRCGQPLRVEGGRELDLLRFEITTADTPIEST